MMSFPFFSFFSFACFCMLVGLYDFDFTDKHFSNIKQFLRNNNKGLRQTTEGFLDFFFHSDIKTVVLP